jgi:hypothetical protein
MNHVEIPLDIEDIKIEHVEFKELGFRSFFHCIKSFDSLIQSLSFEPTVLSEHLKDRL